MSAAILTVLAVVGVVAVFVLNRAVGGLLASEATGQVQDITAKLVERAVRRLPLEHQERWRDEWIADVAALSHRPLKAFYLAFTLGTAAGEVAAELQPATDIAVQPGPAEHEPPTPGADGLEETPPGTALLLDPDPLSRDNLGRLADGAATYEHVIPVALGGTNDPSNLVRISLEKNERWSAIDHKLGSAWPRGSVETSAAGSIPTWVPVLALGAAAALAVAAGEAEDVLALMAILLIGFAVMAALRRPK